MAGISKRIWIFLFAAGAIAPFAPRERYTARALRHRARRTDHPDPTDVTLNLVIFNEGNGYGVNIGGSTATLVLSQYDPSRPWLFGLLGYLATADDTPGRRRATHGSTEASLATASPMRCAPMACSITPRLPGTSTRHSAPMADRRCVAHRTRRSPKISTASVRCTTCQPREASCSPG